MYGKQPIMSLARKGKMIDYAQYESNRREPAQGDGCVGRASRG